MTDAAYLNMAAGGLVGQQQQREQLREQMEQDEVTDLSRAVEAIVGDNLSRNGSSVSGEIATLQDESKENTSHDESEPVGEVI